MSKLKVMTVVGTRPEIIRLSRVLSKLDQFTDHVLVHTGQNYDYELNEIFFKDLGLRAPNHFLNASGGTAAEAIGNVIIRIDPILQAEKPDALLVLGDTNSCLSVIPAKRRKIPIFHMEAGNRCFDLRVPEEINRRIVDHTSDINLPYSDLARSYLEREGFPVDRIVKTGSPMAEVLAHHRAAIEASPVCKELGVEPGKYFVASFHREENIEIDSHLDQIINALNQLAAQYRYPIIVSTHPRTRKKLEARKLKVDPLIQLLKPQGFFHYVNLQKNAALVISDSGTITEESSILGFPAINIREAHERPEGMEEAAVIMSGLSTERILQSVELSLSQKAVVRQVRDYDVPNVSDKVVRIILSYTDYVNRNVWHKGEFYAKA
jgi:UDP-N-acetylglucosamine 2-epimerase (non-hydrolysing)